LLDRIDLHLSLPEVSWSELDGARSGESSAALRRRVADVRQRQIARQGCLNAKLPGAALGRLARPTPAAKRLLERSMDGFGLSARAVHRALRVARTIADLAGEDCVEKDSIGEALSLRSEIGEAQNGV
ncbi:MAG: ATP-binding protein, partial [Myxococcales bacterium]|nr:ATP-binding protein [Myxococcales bacterium]